MPRVYIRKNTNYGRTPPDVMKAAIDDVLVRCMSVREAAKSRGIPRGTLRNNLKKAQRMEQPSFEPNYKHSMVFSDAQEHVMADYLINMSKRYHGLTAKSFRKLVFEVAKANGMRYPIKWNENKIAGKEWHLGFMRRHPTLSLRQPEATSLARVSAFNRYTVGAFYSLLESSYKKMNITGAQIFNLDETGITTTHKVPKVIASKGTKQIGQVTSRERGELVTMCCAVSASGVAIPPVFVFPRKNFRDIMVNGAPEGSLGLVSPSGWMTSDNFVLVIDHLIKNIRPSAGFPIILTMDNHESHISLMALEKAKANHITIITLPPHTSHKTQPLDRTVFGPLKGAFNKAADSWMLQNPNKALTIYQLAELGGIAFTRASTPSNIMSGFRVSGVWPLNKDAFDNDEFMPSMVSDRPLPLEGSTSNNEAMQQASPSEITTQQLVPPSPASATQLHAPSTSGNEAQMQEPVSGTSCNPFTVSPADIRCYPKAQPRKESNRGRKRGRCMVATSTPEIERIKLDYERKMAKARGKSVSAKKLFVDDDSASDISLSDLRDDVMSESEDDACVLKLDVVEKVFINDYVIVEFAQKTKCFYYVGKVTNERDEDGDVEIDFYRKKGGHFVKPAVEDISVVHIDNIKAVLPEPHVRGTTTRTKGELVFPTNFGDINIY